MLLGYLLNKLLMYKNPIKYARNKGTKVGDGCCFVTPPSLGSEPWLIEIGNNVLLSGYVTFLTHDGAVWVFQNEVPYKDVFKYGKIIIRDNCFIGMGSYILPGVEIGENSIVGACSVVTKNVPANSVYAGNPAHYICSLNDFKKKCLNMMPDYDVAKYKSNKREVVLELLQDHMKI